MMIATAERPRPRHRRPVRQAGTRMIPALVVMLLLISGVPAAYAAFSANATTTGILQAAAADFPSYDEQVNATGPAFNYRSDEANGPTTLAADTVTPAQPGWYGAPVAGASTWWTFDEASGAAIDSAGAGNTGTLAGNAVRTASNSGALGRAMTFDGSGDAVTGVAAVNTSTSFTIAARVYVSSNAGTRTLLSQDGAQTSGFRLQLVGNKWTMAMPGTNTATGGTWATATSTTDAVTGQWVHLAGVFDASAATHYVRLYVDGVRQGTQTSRGAALAWNAAGELAAGRGQASGGAVDWFLGSLDEVQTYRRALTDAEVSSLHSGMVGYWPLDDGNGSTAVDMSGRSCAVSGAGGNTWTTGARGGAAKFTALGQHLKTTDTGLIRTDASFSVAAWVELDDTNDNYVAVSAKGGQASGFVLGYTKDAGNVWEFMMPNDGSNPYPGTWRAASASAPVTGTWTHLAGVFDDVTDELVLYVNGVIQGRARHPNPWNATGELVIGGGWYTSSWSRTWSGSIDDVRLYDRALTGSDVGQLYRTPTLRWDFDEASGTVAADGSGNRNPGMLRGGAAFTASGYTGSGVDLAGGTREVAGPAAAVRTDTSFSVSAWAYLSSATGTQTVVSQDGNLVSGFRLYYTGAKWHFAMPASDVGAGTWTTVSSTVSAVAGRWFHLVGVYDATLNQIRLYVDDGATAQTVTARSAAHQWHATGRFVVGRGKSSGVSTDYFTGKIDRVAVMSRTLNLVDVQSLYAETPRLAWDFETSNTTNTAITDVSSNNNNGAMSATAGWSLASEGKNGRAFKGNATSYHAQTSGAVLDTTRSFTAAAWVRLRATATGFRTVIGQDGGAISGFFLQYDGSTWRFDMHSGDNVGSSANFVVSTSPAQLDTWVHVAGVHSRENGVVRLYVNGVWQGSAAFTSPWSAAGSFSVGRGRWNGANADYFDGLIDETWAYQKVLSPVEIRNVMNRTSPTAVASTPTPEPSPLAAGQPGALAAPRHSSTAVAFGGRANGYHSVFGSGPDTFTVQCWFRTGSTTGGALLGFAASPTGMSAENADRMVYVDSGGRLSYVVRPGGVKQTLRTDSSYQDGQWHHVAASLGPAGMKLYVDGVLRKSNASPQSGMVFNGYWRWGGASLSSVDNRPASDYFTGTIDEVTMFTRQLSDQEIAWLSFANF